MILLFKSVQFVDELELVFDNLTIKAMNIGTVNIINFFFLVTVDEKPVVVIMKIA